MTFAELQIKLDRFDLIEEEWSQHSCGGWIYKTAKADEAAKIEGIVSGNAWVSGDAWVEGCHELSFQEWKDKGGKIAKENGYTEEQIAEYKHYIDLFIKIGK